MQQLLFPFEQTPQKGVFPSTRYQGSKRSLVDWIWQEVKHLPFDSVLDVFGGTGAVSYRMKQEGKQVLYNDYLNFNSIMGVALLENASEKLLPAEVDSLLTFSEAEYPSFIEDTFHNIYFTDEENRWLDRLVYHIDHSPLNDYKKAIARFALCQACIIKRPYNLFHRANLYIRLAQVKRTFGNQTTWNTPFETHFRAFVEEANRAVFDNDKHNQSIQGDALDTPIGSDLVYLDPPYISGKGVGVDYRDFYHFLEGLMNYENWHERIDYRSKHRRLAPQPSDWVSPRKILSAFEAVIERHKNSMLVISYRSDGIPSQEELYQLLSRYKKQVVVRQQPKKYVLSHSKSQELLFIAH